MLKTITSKLPRKPITQSHSSEIAIPPNLNLIHAVDSPFDYMERWKFLENKGKEMFGQKFKFHTKDEEVIIKLIIYFLKDPMAALQFNIDLDKGILLNGPVGCGKTSLMKLFRAILKYPVQHSIVSSREIAFEYTHYGHGIFARYIKNAFYRPELMEGPIPVCFDDLGAEPEVQFYGNACHPLGEIIANRNDYFISHHMITHITTNLNASQIENRYGMRVKSRIREMMNILSFEKDADDKRT